MGRVSYPSQPILKTELRLLKRSVSASQVYFVVQQFLPMGKIFQSVSFSAFFLHWVLCSTPIFLHKTIDIICVMWLHDNHVKMGAKLHQIDEVEKRRLFGASQSLTDCSVLYWQFNCLPSDMGLWELQAWVLSVHSCPVVGGVLCWIQDCLDSTQACNSQGRGSCHLASEEPSGFIVTD